MVHLAASKPVPHFLLRLPFFAQYVCIRHQYALPWPRRLVLILSATFGLRFLLPDPASALSPVKRTRLALYLLTLATVVFRSELGLLLASHCLSLLLMCSNISSCLNLIRRTFIPAILAAAVAGLILTVSIDTFFWQSPTLLWPELAAFLSNVFPSPGGLGAAAWGTSPWHWYFTSALPRLMINPLLFMLIPYGLTTTPLRPSAINLLFPNLTYVAVYSLLAHKETRFIFPVVPPVTASFALMASYISTHQRKSVIAKLTTVVLLLTTLLSFFLSHAILLPLSAQTYPGAASLISLHDRSNDYPLQRQIHVHFTNLALQTGVTRFLQHPVPDRPLVVLAGSDDGTRPTLTSGSPLWIYDKSDNQTDLRMPEFWSQFDYVVVEDPEHAIGQWDVIDKVPALGKPRVLRPDVGRGLLVLGSERERREEDGLSRLVGAMYGDAVQWVYGVVHDVVREGYGVRRFLGTRWSWTRGWWLHWGLETKLYVLKSETRGGIA